MAPKHLRSVNRLRFHDESYSNNSPSTRDQPGAKVLDRLTELTQFIATAVYIAALLKSNFLLY
jgi:hypothetical protein